jgi:hypothetical protein
MASDNFLPGSSRIFSPGIERFQSPPRVPFNIADPEHREAAILLLFYGRQHPTIRFLIEPLVPHPSLRQGENKPNYQKDTLHVSVRAFLMEAVLRHTFSGHEVQQTVRKYAPTIAKNVQVGEVVVDMKDYTEGGHNARHSVLPLDATSPVRRRHHR